MLTARMLRNLLRAALSYKDFSVCERAKPDKRYANITITNAAALQY